MSEVVILSDSILNFTYAPRDTEVIQVGGATIRKIAREVRSGRINLEHAKLCIVHAGTSDIGANEGGVIIPRYSDLIYELRKQNDQMQIVVSGILPRPVDYRETAQATKLANKELRCWCSSKIYLHFNSTYRGYQRNNRPRFNLYAENGLHLNWEGTEKAKNIMVNVIALWKKDRLTVR